MKIRLTFAAGALAVAFGPLAGGAHAVECRFPMSVACYAHGVACRYVPEEAVKTRPHDLLCTVAAR